MTTVFVTGATSGFGREIARRYHDAGAQVVACGRRVSHVKELAQRLPGLLSIVLDVRDRTAVTDAIASLPDECAHVDILVNNAGLALGLEAAQNASLDEWHQMIDTNCLGLVNCTRALLPAMVERGNGHIVNIGSTAASYPYPGANVYGATKAFTRQFSLNLRSDLHGTGVRVTCVEPGLCSGTEFSVVRFRGDQDRARAVYEGVQALTPSDIADAVYWATDRPAHVNINTIELMPVAQSFGALPIQRR